MFITDKQRLVGHIVFVNGKPPPLKGDTTKDTQAKVKIEPLNLTKKETEEAKGVKTKLNADVSKVLRWEVQDPWSCGGK